MSVIVPVYNVEQYLEKCVNSILEQTYKNIEIILVDDGGDDECPAICDRFAAEDNRVLCIHKENGGQSFARKTGVESTTGDYVLFVDADDWLEQDAVEKSLRAANEYNADVVYSGFRLLKMPWHSYWYVAFEFVKYFILGVIPQSLYMYLHKRKHSL